MRSNHSENHDGKCPLCGHSRKSVFGLRHTVVWQCTARDCGLQFADPQPSAQELDRAYSDLYYPAEETRAITFENTPDDTFRQAFRNIQGRIGDVRGLRLLDYGCGRGALLRIAREFRLQPSGIEPDPLARSIAAQAAGGEIHESLDALAANDPDPRFDLITLWTVIEHLRNPWSELARLHKFLRPGGWLLMSTMDIRCLRARAEGRKWGNYENPTHLFYFDRKSLQRAIRAAGFSEFSEWRLKIRHAHHGMLRRWLYNVSFSLRLADGIYFLCRRSEIGSEQSEAAASASQITAASREHRDKRELVARARLQIGSETQ